MFYYVDETGTDFFYGRVLEPGIIWGQEITFIISLAALGIAFLLLEKFIKLYASTLLERSKQIETLKEEIRQFKEEIEIEVDLDAPIQKVISTLQNIASDPRKLFVLIYLI